VSVCFLHEAARRVAMDCSSAMAPSLCVRARYERATFPAQPYIIPSAG